MSRDDQWERIEQLLPGKAGDRGCTARDKRRFVEAVLWIMRTGSPWRDLPVEFGHWHRTYVRISRWREKGVFERVAHAMQSDAGMEQLFIDSTIVRAHQHSAGAKKSRWPGNRLIATDAAGKPDGWAGFDPLHLHAIAAAEIAARSRGQLPPPALPDSVCHVYTDVEPLEMMRIDAQYRLRGDGLITQAVRQHEDPQPCGEDQQWAQGLYAEMLAQ